MLATRRRDTPAEVELRSALHRMGLRFRVDSPPLEGNRRRADIVFRRERIAIFVDGCFWHSCPEHGTRPKQNAAWWADKLEQNRVRDADTTRDLTQAGWTVLRFWEHEDSATAAEVVRQAVVFARAKG